MSVLGGEAAANDADDDEGGWSEAGRERREGEKSVLGNNVRRGWWVIYMHVCACA